MSKDVPLRTAWILGSSRSGSTWLLRMLAEFPGAIGIDELHLGHHLGVWRPIPLAWATAAATPELTTFREVKRERPDYLFSDRYRHIWEPGLSQFIGDRVRGQVAAMSSIEDPLVIIKEPGGSQVAQWLLSLFPDSSLIFLLRDGRDVVDSWLDAYRPGTWAEGDGAFPVKPESLTTMVRWLATVWAFRTRAVQQAFDQLPPHRRLIIRYEELLEDPERHVADAASALGLTADSSMITEAVRRHEFGNVPPQERGAGHKVRFARPGRWRASLPPQALTVAAEIMDPLLVKYGYPRTRQDPGEGSGPRLKVRHPEQEPSPRVPTVSSYDEWSHLEEVILGTPYHLDYSNDVSFRLFFYLNLMHEPHMDTSGRWEIFERQRASNKMRDEMEEDLEAFAQTLRAEGVIVRRPDAPTEVKVIQTPNWKAPMGHALMPRDLFLVIGQEIIETAPMVRSRYFETDLYKELLTEYFRCGAKWTVAPRSRLLEKNFDYSFVQQHGYSASVPEEPFYELMFDGAQVLRLGRDLVFNCSTENHRLGATWLQRHLGEDHRVHVVTITDNHIDSSVLALRPGTLLVREGVELGALPERLRSWEVIVYNAIDDTDVSAGGTLRLASQNIGLNVLSIDESRVVVQDIQVGLIRKLRDAGFTPIPCRWRHGRSVGGGFHCLTLDIRRRGALEDYLS